MKKVLILAYTDLKKDPRPFRQIWTIRDKYEVHSIGTSKSGIENFFHPIKKNPFFLEMLKLVFLKIGLYQYFYWDKGKLDLIKKIKGWKFDLIVAHEIRTVPLALKLANGSPVILDAHEYSPLNFNDDLFWRFFYKKYYNYLCSKYIPRVNSLITVSNGIADAYSKNFGINSSIILNASNYHDLKAGEVGEKIKLIHHGIVSSSRSLEVMIEMMDFLSDDYELHLILLYSKSTKMIWKKLVSKAKKNLNIFFIEPVSPEELVTFTNKYDIGIAFFPPKNFNLKYVLPNKFFEYIQARLSILVGPDFEMSPIVKKYEMGFVTEEWNALSLANAISKYSKEEIFKRKVNSGFAAKEITSENEMKIFSEIVNNLL